MKIGIDCRMYGLKHAGIGRYVENLVRNLLSQDKENYYTLVFRPNQKQEVQSFNSKLKIIEADFPHYSFKEQFLLPLPLIKLKLDLVHFPHFNVPVFYPGKYVVTIHDLIKHYSRGGKTTTRAPFLYWLKYLGYQIVFWNAVKRAKKILVPSLFIKDELIHRYRLASDKVKVVYEGADRKFKVQSSKLKATVKSLKLLEKYKIKKPFIVYTGSLYPHKNIERLAQSIKQLNVSRIPCPLSLVVVCARSVFLERLERKVKGLCAEKFINLVGFVPDEELIQIYREAEALVQPSLMEGFDLTVVEAMATGLPVVVSDIPVHREICGQAALYFDPKNIEAMVEKIKLVLESQSLRDKLQKQGLGQVRKYDWKKTARQTLKVYYSVV